MGRFLVHESERGLKPNDGGSSLADVPLQRSSIRASSGENPRFVENGVGTGL